MATADVALQPTVQPLDGWVVRLIDTREWQDSPLPRVLRRLGAKVVYRDTRTTTHVITSHAPPASADAQASWMSSTTRAEFNRAVGHLAERGKAPVCWSFGQLNDLLEQAYSLRHEARQARREAVFADLVDAPVPLPGFVGL